MDTTTKIAIGAVVLSLGILGLATFINEVGPGEYNPIQVRYKDGLRPVDQTYTDASHINVEVTCLATDTHNAVITAHLVATDVQLITNDIKEDMTEIICETLKDVIVQPTSYYFWTEKIQ